MMLAQASSSSAPPWFVAFVVMAGILAAVGATLIRRWDWKRHRQARMRLQGLLVLGALLLVLGLIVSAPLDADARNSLLTFYGVVIAAVLGLTATTHVGNLLAGLILTSRGSFETGDFIRSGELLGGVTEQKLLHTEVETEDGDLTLLPNLRLVTEPLTVLSRSRGTILSAEVSLGYDVPNGEVASVLKAAAGEVAKLQEPFVLISDLGDFSVTYRVAGLLKMEEHSAGDRAPPAGEAKSKILPIISTRSHLRKAILDALHAEGIEIVSPTFMNQRQLQPGDRFIPDTPAVATVAADDEASPEETTFRKVGKNVSMGDLESGLEELAEKKKSLEDQMKGGGTELELQRWADEVAKTQQAIEAQERRIADEKQESAVD
jgi:small conductance mechanosensitive channel